MRLLFVMISMVSALTNAQQFPETMTKLSLRLQGPDIPEESFAAKPKVMYRAGNGYCRTEELPDPEHGIHGLMILNEPDAWMVNLLTNTAQHLADPGPTFNCHLPIFRGEQVKSAADLKNPLLELEFGQELRFFGRSRPRFTRWTSAIRNSSCLRLASPSGLGLWRDSTETYARFSGTAATSNFRLIPSCSRSR